MQEHNFIITPIAIEQIRNNLLKRNTPNSSLRLGVKGGSCEGFSYVIQFEDNEPSTKDILFNFEDIKVIIDKKSLIFLNNSTLTWEKTMMSSGFKFINPKESSKCGCGESVSFKGNL